MLVTIGLILTIICLVYLFLVWNFKYWKIRGVAGPKPKVLCGNFPNLICQGRNIAYDLEDIYRKYKNDYSFVGVFNGRNPQILALSPQLVHSVYVSNFQYFHDNEASLAVAKKSDFIFANNLFALTGDKWRQRRAEITPGLTSGRIKEAYPVTKMVCYNLRNYIRKQIRMPSSKGIDAKDISRRFTSGVVSECVLGLNANSFSNKSTPIVDNVQKLLAQSSLTLLIYFALIYIFPVLKRHYNIRFVPQKIERFFVDLMETAIEVRREQMQLNVHLERIDFLDYILELQDKKNLSVLQMTAHTMTFLFNGFETTAAVITNCLLCLGRNPEIQQKLRKEILANTIEDEALDFERLTELPYLDACVHESIRLFPPSLFNNKLCTEAIEMQNLDGTNYTVAKGDVIILPLYSIMMDEDYFPNPQAFIPERFFANSDAMKKYHDHGCYFGFGDGPRSCPGRRFALTQIKAAIVEIVRNFNVKINPKTRTDNELDAKYFIACLKGGVWLNFEDIW